MVGQKIVAGTIRERDKCRRSAAFVQKASHVSSSEYMSCPAINEAMSKSEQLMSDTLSQDECKNRWIYYGADDGTLEIRGGSNATDHITIPGKISGISVSRIAQYAFSDRLDLTSVTISEGIVEIDECAFINCRNLIEVFIPASVQKISPSAFDDCSSLQSVHIDPASPYSTDGALLFQQRAKTLAGKFQITGEYHIPNWIRKIDDKVFANCSSLTSVVIPDSVTEIGEWAFYDCCGLTRTILPSKLTRLGAGAFQYCVALREITLPESLPKIEEFTFLKCTNLIHIKIPGGVHQISSYAFYGCTSLTDVTFSERLVGIGQGAFFDCPHLTIHAPEKSTAERYAKENGIPFAVLE